MRSFLTGSFKRERLRGPIRALCPLQAVGSVNDISPDELLRRGKRLVLLDIDNTLVPWQSESFPAASLAWIKRLKDAGLRLCILSNTRRPARLDRVARKLDVPYLRGKFKPSPRMYHQALADFGVSAKEAVMVGDQLFTDVLGANRAGIEAIWVQPIARREFAGTKVSRLGEAIVRSSLYRVMERTHQEGR